MSGSRRGFLALVGGSLAAGGALVTGTVRRANAATPGLRLPPALEVPPATTGPAAGPLLARHDSEMQALIHVKRQMPEAAWRDWLEGGLRQADLYGGRDGAALERSIDAAVARHGSLVAAMRAGAL